MLYIDKGITLILNVLKINNQLITIFSLFKTMQTIPMCAGLFLAPGFSLEEWLYLLSLSRYRHKAPSDLEFRHPGRLSKCKILIDVSDVSPCFTLVLFISSLILVWFLASCHYWTRRAFSLVFLRTTPFALKIVSLLS